MRLPSNRAFVVQFAGEGPAEGPVRGRVEHLASGRVTHFASWARLQEFLAQNLGDERRGRDG